MSRRSDFFASPAGIPMRRYEALRAYLHEGLSMAEAAQRGGYTYGSFRNLVREFRKEESPTFFWPKRPRPAKTRQTADPRPPRIVTLRQSEALSIYEIQDRLKKEGMKASIGYIQGIFKKNAIKRLPRRRPSERARSTVKADRRALDLSPRTFYSEFAGLFLFAFDLVRLQLDDILTAVEMPGTKMIPAGCAMRSLLALKLWSIARPSHVMADAHDEGLALFAGLNTIPKRTALTEYSIRVDPLFAGPLMQRWYDAAAGLTDVLGSGASFDLDFHTIPYHGHQAQLQKHYVSKRSRRQLGILTFLARDAEARVFAYADATERKETQRSAIMRFARYWKEHTGRYPGELVFDSGLTSYKYLNKLNEQDIDFITIRRRHESLTRRIALLPKEAWTRIRLTNIHRAYRRPRIVDELVKLRGYRHKLRQILVKDLGHDKPTILITNQMKRPASQLVDRYARRMVIENVISDAIDFFHMDALSAAVPMRINVDVQLTVMASVLYRLIGVHAANGYEKAESRTIFRDLVRHSGKVTVTQDEITVRLRSRAKVHYLLAAGYPQMEERVPWLGNKLLRIQFA